jgi:hypothetical protein
VEVANLDWPSLHAALYCNGHHDYPLHSPKELKERYLAALKAGITTEHWSTEEDMRLLQAVREEGTHWRRLA